MRIFLLVILLFLLEGCGPQNGRRPVESLPSEESGGAVTTRMEPVTPEGHCQYDNDASLLGIGLLLAPEEFTIFNDASLREGFATVDLYADDEGHDGICPKFFAPEYGIMQFVCIDSTAGAYQVLTDHSSVKYISKTSGAEFRTWSTYILDSFGVRRIGQVGGDADVPPPIKREPSAGSASVTIPAGHEMFCPMEVRGDWVKVKYDCFYNQEQNPHEGEPCHNFIEECEAPLTGWVQWREGNRLLIEVFLMP